MSDKSLETLRYGYLLLFAVRRYRLAGIVDLTVLRMVSSCC